MGHRGFSLVGNGGLDRPNNEWHSVARSFLQVADVINEAQKFRFFGQQNFGRSSPIQGADNIGASLSTGLDNLLSQLDIVAQTFNGFSDAAERLTTFKGPIVLVKEESGVTSTGTFPGREENRD
jgi:hypothetical protein